MPIKSDNLNLNLNLGAANAGAGAPLGRVRFNTEDVPKLLNLPGQAFAATPAFSHAPNWDAEGRAWEYLLEFVRDIALVGGGNADDIHRDTLANWLTHVQDQLDTGGQRRRCPAGPNAKMNLANLNDELADLVDASLDRADRLQEILDQADGEGALNYWTGMLALNPATRPNTHLLIRVGRRIGELIVMRLKAHYMCPRPSRVHPMILPVIDPPNWPSYPSGHATVSHFISELLMEAFDTDPPYTGPTPPPITPPAHLKFRTLREALRKLAARVAENRTVAGLHFVADNVSGEHVAQRCMKRALLCPGIAALILLVRAEMIANA